MLTNKPNQKKKPHKSYKFFFVLFFETVKDRIGQETKRKGAVPQTVLFQLAERANFCADLRWDRRQA